MRDPEWHGIFPIPVTPFNSDGSVDNAGLQRQVEFCVTSGARGIVYPGVVSEFFTLSEAERRDANRAVVEAIDGRVPFVAGVAGTSAATANAHALDSASIGADGVMAVLPYVKHFYDPDYDFVREYYKAIASAELPIVLQNARIGSVVGFEVLRRLLDDVPLIRYLKQETSPSTHAIGDALSAVGDQLAGVFAGLGGVYLVNELERGACGSMPAPPFVDVLSRAYDAYVAGDLDGTYALTRRLAPLFNLELLYNVSFIKRVLVIRGVIRDATCRVPAPVMDAIDIQEIESSLEYAGIDRWRP